MTQKRVKASDVIGNSYYIYTLESSNNTPTLNGTINITCNVTDVYGQAVSGKSITLYQNSTSKGVKTTDSNGNASWNSISMSSAGLQTFKVENSKIEVFVDNKSDVGHTHSQYLTEHQSLTNYVTTDDSRLSDSRTPTSHTHGNINNNGTMTVASSTMAGNAQYIVYSDSTNGALKRTDLVPASYIRDPAAHSSLGTSTGATQDTINNAINSKINDKLDKVQSSYKGKNVVTNASTGAIEFEDKPTIPSASSTTPSADTTNGSVGTGTTWARSDHTHPKSSLYAESSHNHTKSQITDFPTIPSKTSDLQNDSGFLTSHQSLSGYLRTSDVKDNLTSTDTDKPLSAKQGKELKSLIDNKEDKIYRIVGTGTQIGTLFPNRVELQGTFPFDSVNGKIIVYVVPDISSLSEDLLLDLQGTYPSGSTIKFNIRKSNDAPISIGEIQTGDELLLFYDNSRWRLIGNSSISGKIDTAGTGLSKSGTTLNHSNSITALTTASFKKVKYDSQGHITGTSDVSASDLPTHTHSQYLTSHQDITGKEDSSNKVSSWNSTTNNTRYPTEKLVKDSLDGKQATLVSGTNIRTINNTPILGSGNIVIPTPPTIVTAWESTPSDSKVASEKLTKDSLDGKADNNHTHEVLLSSNDDSDIQLFNVSAQGIPQGESQSLGAFLLEFWKKIYPIGSIYMNTNNVDPAILFGGEWEQIQDRFLLASGSTYSAGSTGGSANATLVSHQHGTNESGEYFVTSEANGANNTKVSYSASGNRYVDGMTSDSTPFHHRVGTSYVGVSATGKNMPPYLVVYMWKRIA